VGVGGRRGGRKLPVNKCVLFDTSYVEQDSVIINAAACAVETTEATDAGVAATTTITTTSMVTVHV